MYRLIPNSTLHVYSGGHLELAVDAERIAQVVGAFLTAEEVQDDTGRWYRDHADADRRARRHWHRRFT